MVEVGLKLGANQIAIIKEDVGKVLIQPSVVALKIVGPIKVVKAVGNDAVELANKDSNIILYSPITYGRINDKNILTTMLRKFLLKVIKNTMALSCTVALPCAVDMEQMLELKEVLLKVGVDKVKFVPNGVCARIGGCNLEDFEVNMVVDIGKYLTDISVLDGKNFILGRDLQIGGQNINENIIAFVEDNYSLKIDDYVAENLKLQLATLYNYDNNELSFYGINETGKLKKANINSKSLQVALKSSVDSILEEIKNYFSNLDPDLQNQIVKNGILFTGGVTKISGFLEYAMKKFEFPIYTSLTNEDAVLSGLGKIVENGSPFYIEW